MEQNLRPGKWLYGLAAGIFFIGGIVFFVLLTLGTRNDLRHEQKLTEELVRIPISPEGQIVRLADGENLVFIEHQKGDGAEDLVDVRVTSTAGDEITQFEPAFPSSYASEDRVGSAYSAIDIDGLGDYRVTATYLGDQSVAQPSVAVGPWPSNGPAVLLWVVGFGGFVLSLVAGIVLALVAFFMRRSRRKQWASFSAETGNPELGPWPANRNGSVVMLFETFKRRPS
jgi:hypothetical protein